LIWNILYRSVGMKGFNYLIHIVQNFKVITPYLSLILKIWQNVTIVKHRSHNFFTTKETFGVSNVFFHHMQGYLCIQVTKYAISISYNLQGPRTHLFSPSELNINEGIHRIFHCFNKTLQENTECSLQKRFGYLLIYRPYMNIVLIQDQLDQAKMYHCHSKTLYILNFIYH